MKIHRIMQRNFDEFILFYKPAEFLIEIRRISKKDISKKKMKVSKTYSSNSH